MSANVCIRENTTRQKKRETWNGYGTRKTSGRNDENNAVRLRRHYQTRSAISVCVCPIFHVLLGDPSASDGARGSWPDSATKSFPRTHPPACAGERYQVRHCNQHHRLSTEVGNACGELFSVDAGSELCACVDNLRNHKLNV